MYNNERIGIGIITCNRKESYKKLVNQIKLINDVDFVITVKNKDFDYSQDDPLIICNNLSNLYSEHISEDVGVGYCKNICLKKLLNEKCDHIFLIEDDINIKNSEVFKKFIDTAKHFNIGHMNWNTLPLVNNRTYNICYKDIYVDISFKLCGSFSYFSRDALQYCGIINDQDYINVLEHAEHAYRMSINKFAPPFYAFPSIHKCENYLEDTSTISTIDHDSIQYRLRSFNAMHAFENTYGKLMSKLPIPTVDDIKKYFIERLKI